MRHLTPAELIDSLDGTLPSARDAHLRACAACHAERRRLARVLRDVSLVDVPEPSPLFWDHLSARVRARIAAEPVPTALSAWRAELAAGLAIASWRHWMAAAAVLVVAVALGFMAWTLDRAPRGSSATARGARQASVDRLAAGTSARRGEARAGASAKRDTGRLAVRARTADERMPGEADTEPGGRGASMAVAPVAVSGDADWAMMIRMAEDIAWEDQERGEAAEGPSMMYVRPGTVERALNELSSDERRALVKLLRAELARPKS